MWRGSVVYEQDIEEIVLDMSKASFNGVSCHGSTCATHLLWGYVLSEVTLK